MPQNAPWPSPGDYSTAIQNPRNCFSDPELRSGSVRVNSYGLPVGASGNFAVVYQMEASGKLIAVRCLIRPVSDQEQRYDALSKHLEKFFLPTLVEFSYQRMGIRVRGQCYPVVKMEWVSGKQLQKYVADNYQDSATLQRLAAQWRGVVSGLWGAHTAHGDLQHGNILVNSQGQMKLVDYDGFFLPALRNRPPGEVGHPNYQHPQRIEKGHYEENCDAFSALVIYLSLVALSADVGLWVFNNGENLIFLAGDFKNPGQTPVWKRLHGSPDPEVRRLTIDLERLCREPVSQLPDLEQLLQALPASSHRQSIPGIPPTPPPPLPPDPLQMRVDQLRSYISLALSDKVLTSEEEVRIGTIAATLQIPITALQRTLGEELRRTGATRAAAPRGVPQLEVLKTRFAFPDVRVGSSVSDEFAISNAGGGTLQGSVVSNRPWLKLGQTSIDPTRHRQDIGFAIDTSALPLGFKDTGAIEVRSSGGTSSVQVSLSVEIPDIAISRLRNSATWVGLLVGGLLGYVLYALVPMLGLKQLSASIAGFAAMLVVIIVSARRGGFYGGCGGFVVMGMLLSILAKFPHALSTVSWALTYGMLLNLTARQLFLLKQMGTRAVVRVVGIVGAVLPVGAILLAYAFLSAERGSFTPSTSVPPKPIPRQGTPAPREPQQVARGGREQGVGPTASVQEVLQRVRQGNVVTPPGASAYDIFLDFGQRGLREEALVELRNQLLPLLKAEGDASFRKWHDQSNLGHEDWKKLERLYSWAANLDSDDSELSARLQYARGQTRSLQGNPREAEGYYREAARLSPNWAMPINALGRTAVQQQDLVRAEEFYKKAIDLEPGWVYPYINLGSIYVRTHRNELALPYYRRAAELAPEKPTTHYRLGAVYESLQRNGEARQEYQLALQLVQRSPTEEVSTEELRRRIEGLGSSR